MKRFNSLLLIISLLLLSIILIACAKNNEPIPAAVKDVSVQEFKHLIENNPAYILIDVRTPAEFIAGHIANAININFEAADFQTNIQKYDKTKTYLVYCQSGNRSKQATDLMISAGFKHVYNMLGGITAWQSTGYPVVQ